ncbi:hypothetical protein GCM10025773_21490 [Microbacterium jejuense]
MPHRDPRCGIHFFRRCARRAGGLCVAHNPRTTRLASELYETTSGFEARLWESYG